MYKDLIFSMFGGLGLFIYGIHMMGTGLQKASANKMRKILGALTKNALTGVLVGAGVTSIIQSSSATTVMLVGFVNAGLMTLKQSLGVILGANIGTTITAQLIAFKLTDYALPIIGIGMFTVLFARKKSHKSMGEFMLGFGILFLGLSLLTQSVQPLGALPQIKEIFVTFSTHPFLAILAGTIFTAVVQSSSVTTGIILALAMVNLVNLQGAVYLIFGCNIGTCVTALIASIGTTISARRTALAHVIFNCLGVLIFLPLAPVLARLVQYTSTNIMRQCANVHTLFNVGITVLFLPFIGGMAKFLTRLVPGKEVEIEFGPKYLERHLLNTPSLALRVATEEIVRTLKLTHFMVNQSMEAFFKGESHFLSKVERGEDAVDNLQEAITDYLVELMQGGLSEEESLKIPALLHIINDVERIGDHAENLAELAERKIESKLSFSQEAVEELHGILKELEKMFEASLQALEENDLRKAEMVLEQEETINRLRDQLKNNHIKRLEHGKCIVLSGIVFLDTISNFEKIADHLTNIAQAVSDALQWERRRVGGI